MLKRAIKNHLSYLQTVRELEALSDRDLRDLGIFRCDIRNLAKGKIKEGI